MADIRNSLKGLLVKGMEAIGNTASNIASNTKFKVDEMNLVNRRREILSSFGQKSYEMWQKGEHFPAVLEEQLEELSQLDIQLNVLRAERLANLNTEPEENACAETETSEEEDIKSEIADKSEHEETNPEDFSGIDVTAENDGEDRETTEPLSNAINDLFEKIPTADEASAKVNEALDTIGETLQHIGQKIDQEFDSIQDKQEHNDQ